MERQQLVLGASLEVFNVSCDCKPKTSAWLDNYSRNKNVPPASVLSSGQSHVLTEGVPPRKSVPPRPHLFVFLHLLIFLVWWFGLSPCQPFTSFIFISSSSPLPLLQIQGYNKNYHDFKKPEVRAPSDLSSPNPPHFAALGARENTKKTGAVGGVLFIL